MRKRSIIFILSLAVLSTAGCAEKKETEKAVEAETLELEIETKGKDETAEILKFVDVFGQSYEVEVNGRVKKHDFDLGGFRRDGYKLYYEKDDRYQARLGIDVSEHQGDIDWQKVKEDGYEFAFIRIGYRGYGQEGRICEDAKAAQNLQAARNAGIETGVYFFAQAVNEEEAREEAEFVLDRLAGYELELPVVYDPESILDDEARTDQVSGEQFTKNTETFCERIEEAGYQPMIYCNMLWEAYELDLEALAEYPVWYADYEPLPQTPYTFEVWQYTNEGQVEGIEGPVDLNIQLRSKNPQERPGGRPAAVLE